MKKILITIAVSIFASLIGYGYFEYQNYFELKNEMVKLNFSSSEPFLLQSKADYIFLFAYEKGLEDFKSKYELKITPDFPYILEYSSQSELTRKLVTQEALDDFKKRHNIEKINYITEEDILKEAAKVQPDTKMIYIRKLGEDLTADSIVKITLISKTPNIWKQIFGGLNADTEYKVIDRNSAETRDTSQALIDSFIFDQTNGAGSRQHEEYMEKLSKACPFREAKNDQIYSFNNFSYLNISCGYAGQTFFDGEEVTVEIYTQDIEEGKKDFLNELAKYGFQPSAKLRVIYTHKPGGNKPELTPPVSN